MPSVMKTRSAMILCGGISLVALMAWGSVEAYRSALASTGDGLSSSEVPTTRVRRGDVAFTVASKGELQGGNSHMLSAPMMGGAELILTELRQPGELVKKGEVVAKFDTTEQQFRLREAEADLAEAEQQIQQTQQENEAKAEEDRYAQIKARGDVGLAELECRRNPLLATITATQNNLALDAAKDQLNQLLKDLGDRTASSKAALKIQEAAFNKAKVLAETARRNIESMSLTAPAEGYISLQQNTNTNFFFMGMQLPSFQVGDTVRPGQAVAQIPDLASWEITAKIGEQDRGHLNVGQGAEIQVVGVPGRKFKGSVKNLGGTFGPPWDRRFECKISLDDPASTLRPGMTAQMVISTETMKDVLWLPAQALQSSDGRTFVYVRKDGTFSPADVKLVRRGESKVVISGLAENQEVALANPENRKEKKSDSKPGLPGKGPA